MTPQARPSAKIMGLDTHMILEAVPARLQNTGTGIRPSTRTLRDHAGTLGSRWPRRPGVAASTGRLAGHAAVGNALIKWGVSAVQDKKMSLPGLPVLAMHKDEVYYR